MTAVLHFVMKHGYAILFGAMFAHQIGFPIPGPLFLLATGALVASGRLGLVPALGLSVTAAVLADLVWFEAGRRRGDKVLHFLHSLTRDPDAHDRRAKEVFARYGPPLLLVAKFVPGLDAVLPPLAGTSGTSRFRFLALDALGAALYSGAYIGLGIVFRHDLDRAAKYAGRVGAIFAGLALAAFLLYELRKLFRRHRLNRQSRLVQVALIEPLDCVASTVQHCGIVEGFTHGD